MSADERVDLDDLEEHQIRSDDGLLSLSQVAAMANLTRDQLNLYVKQKYVFPIEVQKGTRTVKAFTLVEAERVRHLAELIAAGNSPKRASAMLWERGVPFTEHGLATSASHDELGEILDLLRDDGADGKTAIDAANNYINSLNGPDKPKVEEPFGGFQKLFSSSFFRGKEARFLDVRMLTDRLGIHPLLVDPLFSRAEDRKATDENFTALDLSADFVPVGEARDSRYGYRAQYSIPWKRLPDSLAMFGMLRLQPNGASDRHDHAGEELMLCLEGQVTVEISGYPDMTLRPGEAVHFWSEQMHQAKNLSATERASVFVIRFYHASVRSDAMKPEAWTGGMPQWVKNIIEPAPSTGDAVEDLLGLGSFLRKFLPGRPSFTIDGNPPLKSEDIENGRCAISKALLPEIAKAYGCKPILLENYVGRAVRGVSYLQPQAMKLATNVGAPVGVLYRLPEQNLLHSDLNLAEVSLEKGASTAWNHHPGIEVAIPLSGSISLYFNNKAAPVAAAECAKDRRSILIYQSGQEHALKNDTDESCRVLVIRLCK